MRVFAHLIRLPEQTHLVVSRTDQIAIAGSTLTLVDELSSKIVKTIDAKLRDPNVRTAAMARGDR